MAFQRIRIKNTNVAGKIPGADKLDTAELCINLKDQKLFSKDADGNVFEFSGGGSVNSGPTPPNSGNEIGDLFFDTVNEILLYWNGSEWLPVAGDLEDQYVKLNDEGDEQNIIGGGGLDIKGPVQVFTGVGQTGTRIGTRQDGTEAVGYFETNRSVTGADEVAQFTGQDGSVTFKGDGSGTFQGGVTSEFGTSTAQIGNVAPLNDWSCYPARA